MQDELYTELFGKPDQGKAEFLKDIIRDFPYFTVPHYFLLKETSLAHPDYPVIAGTTGLHFNNPFYLSYKLHNKSPEEFTRSMDHSSQNTGTDENKKKPAINEESLVFEPLYATDYFASQGIKLSEEIKPDDKLGKQLRSFTDWLKTMKKVHGEKMAEGANLIDEAVQNIAEKSNTEEEILTESMAEVYISQGKTGRAREIYHKLSLINPAKSAYFAAKIDSLKN